MVKSCTVCGTEFETNNIRRVYCSHKCAQQHFRSSIQPQARKCRYCGKEFTPNIAGQIYCSDVCRFKFNNKKRNTRERMCEVCGKIFTFDSDAGAGYAYCSPECRRESNLTERFCKNCGKRLEGKQLKYCGPDCAKKKKPVKAEPLHVVAAKAAAMGMTYGEYMTWRRDHGR